MVVEYDPNSVCAKYGRLYELMDEIYLVDKKEGESQYKWFRSLYKYYREWAYLNFCNRIKK